jgi:hypothetical protein
MSPASSALLGHVLVGASVLFAIAYLGNRLTFSSRLVNALVTALIFAICYGALYFAVHTTLLPPEIRQASQHAWMDMIATSAILVFVVDLTANALSFSNRLTSALVTAGLFAVGYAILIYAMGGLSNLSNAI